MKLYSNNHIFGQGNTGSVEIPSIALLLFHKQFRLFGILWGNDSCIRWIPAFAGMTTITFVSFP